MRCDNKNDCDDSSDEMNCQYLPNLENYNKGIAPMTMNINKNNLATTDTSVEVGKCTVYISTTINTFRSEEAQKHNHYKRINKNGLFYRKIDTTNLQFTSNFILNLRWYDSRVRLFDLNNETALNHIESRDVQLLWTPSDILLYTVLRK